MKQTMKNNYSFHVTNTTRAMMPNEVSQSLDGSRDVECAESAPVARFQVVETTEVKDILTRWVQISALTFASTDTPLTTLNTMDPLALWLGNTTNQQVLDTFTGLQGDFEVKVESSFPSNAYGLYTVRVVADGGNGVVNEGFTTSEYFELNAASIIPWCRAPEDNYGEIDVTRSNTLCFDLPFLSNMNFYTNPADSGDKPYTINTYCVIQCKNGQTATAVSGDVIFKMRLKPGYVTFRPQRQSGVGSVDEFAAKHGKPSEVLQSTSELVGTLAPIPIIGGVAAVASAGLAVASSVANVFGFTKVSYGSDPTPMKLVSSSSIAAVDGNERSEMVSLFSGAQLSLNRGAMLGDINDPTSFANLLGRPSVVDIFDWATTDVAGTILRTIPVTPGFCYKIANVWYPCAAGMLALPFTFWRGRMIYRINVICSVFHRGALQIIWDPSASTAFPENPTNTNNNITIPISGPTCIDLSVDYLQKTMMREMILTARGDTGFTNESAVANGFLHFRISNKLQAPLATATASIMVSACCDGDLELSMPRQYGYKNKAALTPDRFEDSYRLQSAEMDNSCNDQQVSLVQNRYKIDSTEFVGESYKSVRPFFSKFSYTNAITMTTALPTNYTALSHYPPIPSAAAAGMVGAYREFNYAGYYMSFFVGIRGSSRLKCWVTKPITSAAYSNTFIAVKTRLCNNAIVGNAYSSTSATPALGLMNGSLQIKNSNQLGEFEFPPAMNARYHLIRYQAIPGVSTTGFADLISVMSGPYSTATNGSDNMVTAYFQALGSDVSVNRFRASFGVVRL